MSTNLEYRARERQRKRESRRQASEAQREKGRQGFRARDKKQRRHFFVGRTTWKFCSRGKKMRNTSGHQYEVKMSGSEKKVNKKTCLRVKTFAIWRWKATDLSFQNKCNLNDLRYLWEPENRLLPIPWRGSLFGGKNRGKGGEWGGGGGLFAFPPQSPVSRSTKGLFTGYLLPKD